MPELLTESFCERCGTRYTFEAPQSQHSHSGRLKQARAVARGLRNYVLDDELPLDAALADARRDDDRIRAEQQLEAFHQAFNFCMDCRQYTCLECWNEAEGRCLSCAPRPGLLALTSAEAITGPALLAAPSAGSSIEPPAEPSLREAIEALALPAETVAEAPETTFEPAPLPEPVAAMAEPALPSAPPEPPPPEPVRPTAPPASELPSIDLPQIEPLAATAEPAISGPFAIAPLTVPPEPSALEPLAATSEPPPPALQPTPSEISLFPQPRPIGPVTPPPVPEPTPAAWPPAVPLAHDLPPAPLRPPPVPPPARPGAAPWPPLGGPLGDGPAWPTGPSPLAPSDRLTAASPALAAPVALGPWEASVAQVTARSAGATVQSCVSCGLALSATARFCRRCGSRQAA